MNKKPKVSVVVPLYNQKEMYLRKCLDSLKNQTLKEIEFIVVNDGSTDTKCIEICNSYCSKDNRFVLVNQPNGGMGKAYNTGMKIAKGEYIGFLESDDWAEKNMFKKLYEKAIETNVDIVKSDFYFYREVPTEQNEYFYNYDLDEYDYVIDLSWDHKIFWKLPCLWTAIYRRDFLQKNNILFNETPGASYQDTSFAFIVYALAKNLYYMQEAFIHYRIDNEYSSVNNKNKVYCICDEFKFIEQFLDKNPNKKNKLEYLKNFLKYYLYVWNFNRITKPFKLQFLLKMSSQFKQEFKMKAINKNYFSPSQYEELEKITKHPYIYYINRYVKGTLK